MSKQPSWNFSSCDEGEPLCTLCSILDLQALLTTKSTKRQGFTISRGKKLQLLRSIQSMQTSSCRLCRFFAAFALSIYPIDQLKHHALNLYTYERHQEREGGGVTTRTVLCVGFEPELSLPKSFLWAVATPSPSELTGQQDGLVDYSLLKSWLRSCQEKDCSNLNVVSPHEEDRVLSGMQPVDCNHQFIVSATITSRYAALSYVWGHATETADKPLVGCQLPQTLPRVIDDAIAVTKTLGMTYLWIDRYCIPQEPDSKHNQIRNMDRIYRNAEFTIVSLDNSPMVSQVFEYRDHN